jgi:hypothetical protein
MCSPPAVVDMIDSIAHLVRHFAKKNAYVDVGHARAVMPVGKRAGGRGSPEQDPVDHGECDI